MGPPDPTGFCSGSGGVRHAQLACQPPKVKLGMGKAIMNGGWLPDRGGLLSYLRLLGVGLTRNQPKSIFCIILKPSYRRPLARGGPPPPDVSELFCIRHQGESPTDLPSTLSIPKIVSSKQGNLWTLPALGHRWSYRMTTISRMGTNTPGVGAGLSLNFKTKIVWFERELWHTG